MPKENDRSVGNALKSKSSMESHLLDFFELHFRHKEEGVPEDVAELRRERHRQAQACYREANQTVLQMLSWENWLAPVPSFLDSDLT